VLQAEKLAAAGRLAATVAHEINNPLEAVTNFIFLAKNTQGLPPRTLRHLEIADQELTRVSHIAQQTLGFYRDRSQPQLVNVSEAVRQGSSQVCGGISTGCFAERCSVARFERVRISADR
jgi:signal transduction histidine kinase